ncbi:MAG: hypothetical protein MPJ22_06280 [Pirellulales bacterium]|nr:hypothetical protein [Alphaproteobacteria bacterium]MDA8042009.1 hypothetical protein [Pirellulales bacterium]
MSNHIKEIRKLAEIRRPVDKLRALVPNWMDIDSLEEIHSAEKKESALSLVVEICGNPKVNLAALESPISVKPEDQKNFVWYKNDYPSAHDKAIYLLRRKFLTSWDGIDDVLEHTTTSGSEETIKAAFFKTADFVDQFLHGIDDEECQYLVEEEGMDVSSCKAIIEARYFQPDKWYENSQFFPVTVTTDLQKMPKGVRQRIAEIHRSFIFGNWMAVIALSRCLLEYAFTDKALDFKIPKHNGLADFIPDFSKRFRELEAGMKRIQKVGNHVMHVKSHPIPLDKKRAKKCVDDIVEIIGALYRD